MDELNAVPQAPVVSQPESAPSTDAAPQETPSVTVVVASKVKAVVKARGLRSDGKLADALNAQIISLIESAADRAKADGRATVRPHDLAA